MKIVKVNLGVGEYLRVTGSAEKAGRFSVFIDGQEVAVRCRKGQTAPEIVSAWRRKAVRMNVLSKPLAEYVMISGLE